MTPWGPLWAWRASLAAETNRAEMPPLSGAAPAGSAALEWEYRASRLSDKGRNIAKGTARGQHKRGEIPRSPRVFSKSGGAAKSGTLRQPETGPIEGAGSTEMASWRVGSCPGGWSDWGAARGRKLDRGSSPGARRPRSPRDHRAGCRAMDLRWSIAKTPKSEATLRGSDFVATCYRGL